jgi:hypothetical protein
MSRGVSIFLYALAAFMVVQWTMLAFNLGEGHPTSFYVIHGALIGVNILLAVILALVTLRSRRAVGR